MIKNILAVIGVLAIVAGGIALAVFKPWEKPDVVSVESSSPVVYFDALRDEGIFVERVRIEPGKKPRAVLYVSYSKFFKAPVILRAFDGNRNEIGRSRRVLSGDVEDADYADFVKVMGGTVVEDNTGWQNRDHLMGTVIMGSDAKDSVVNHECRTFDHPNLFLATTGVIPASGTINPTLTGVALSIRLADIIAREV